MTVVFSISFITPENFHTLEQKNLQGLFVWTYQLESTVFFSHNKTASAGSLIPAEHDTWATQIQQPAWCLLSLLFDLNSLRTNKISGTSWLSNILHSNTHWHIAKMSGTNLPPGLLHPLLSPSRIFPWRDTNSCAINAAEKMAASFVVHCFIPSATASQVRTGRRHRQPVFIPSRQILQ